MIEFPIQFDSVTFNSKPTSKDVSQIKPRLAGVQPTKANISLLEKAVLSGRSFSPAVLNGGAKAENWSCQQVFCVDIDNEDKTSPKGEKRQSENPLTIDEVFKRCEEWDIKPSLIYETFSSSHEWLKFRVVFISDKLITNGIERDCIQLALMEIFPECDTSCKNRDRLFFGGRKTIYADGMACFSPLSINALGQAAASKQAFTAFDKNNSKGSESRLDELKRSFDFLSYIRSFGGSERRAGRYICFNPCPICGHNDDFIYYPNTNTFMCFGKNGNKGGSIIDFLIYTENLDRKSAIDKFKYELCGLSKAEEKSIYRKECMRNNVSHSEINFPSDELPPYIVEKINEKTGEVSYYVSCPLLAKYIREHCHYLQIQDRLAKASRLFWYDGGVYKPINDDKLQGYIKKYITAVDETLLKMRDVQEVMKNLKTDLNFVDESRLNSDENVINFKNGLLSLQDMKLYPHNPNIFSTIQIPCNYNPKNIDAPIFCNFLQALAGGDKEKEDFLLEYMGVCVSNIKGYRMKQALFMYGKGNTGKSQLKALTESLLGSENCSACDLSTLEERFGTSQLYLKRLVGSGDMSFMSVKELKIFKNATGGDDVFIEFKGRDGFRYKFGGQFWFCMNELPRFGGDRGEWVYKRIIAFDCNNVIAEDRQDKFLLDKMFSEREAIINLLIPAIQRVINNGYKYTIPEKCKTNNAKYSEDNSPVKTFFKECCVMREGKIGEDSCTTGKMYKVFKAWYADNFSRQVFCPPSQQFRKELAEICGASDISEIEYRTNSKRYYKFTLNLQTKTDYSVSYGFDEA